MSVSGFEIVVGLEVHIQLNTRSKMFCGDSNTFGDEPNVHTSAISLAHPGTLPVVNKAVIEKAIGLALAIGADINPVSYFDRKHYFYPDLPKAYQITQDRIPYCRGGQIEIFTNETKKSIRIHHIHIEEDAGKSIHIEKSGISLVDLNRAGVPLLELVTEPDLRSGNEVHDFIGYLQQLVRYLGISDARMEEGSMRCDCNVSVRTIGSRDLGERCEIKNLNSKKFAMKAVEMEAKRQIDLLLSGAKISQTTMHFDPDSGRTIPSREKETAMDYRYFPDPDLPPLVIAEDDIASVRQNMPLLPQTLQLKLSEEYGLSEYQSEFIARELEIAEYFLELSKSYKKHSPLANLIINKILPHCKEEKKDLSDFSIPNGHIFELLDLIESEQVLSSVAYQALFPEMLKHPQERPSHLARKQGIIKNRQSLYEIENLIQDLIASNPNEVMKYREGKKSVIGFFIGEAMKQTQGALDPKEFRVKMLKALEGSA